MTRIRCRDRRCSFNKNGICTAEEIEYEPDAGCLTMELREDVEEEDEEEEWEDDELADDLDDDFEEEEEEEDEDWEGEEQRDGFAPNRRKRR